MGKKKSTLQSFLNPPNSPHFNTYTEAGYPSELLQLPCTFIQGRFCTCTKQRELPLQTAVAATQEAAAPKHIGFLCKSKAAIFVFVTSVVLGAHPNTKISDAFVTHFSPKCCLQRGKWVAPCCRAKF